MSDKERMVKCCHCKDEHEFIERIDFWNAEINITEQLCPKCSSDCFFELEEPIFELEEVIAENTVMTTKELAHIVHGMELQDFMNFIDYNFGQNEKYNGFVIAYFITDNDSIVVDFGGEIYVYANDNGFSRKEKTELVLNNIPLKIEWNSEFDYFKVDSSLPHEKFQVLCEMHENVEFEGIVFSVDDLEGGSNDFTSIIIQDGLEMKSKITDLEILNKAVINARDDMTDTAIKLKADLAETKILAADRQNQILKLKQDNKRLGIIADTLQHYRDVFEKKYHNLIDTSAKDAVAAKDKIDELTNELLEAKQEIRELMELS